MESIALESLHKIPVSSLQDFKRKIQPGVSIATTYHMEAAGRDENQDLVFKDKDLGVARIARVQSNAFTVMRKKKDGTPFESWLHYPAASMCEIKDGSIIIFEHWRKHNGLEEKLPCLTYTLVQ